MPIKVKVLQQYDIRRHTLLCPFCSGKSNRSQGDLICGVRSDIPPYFHCIALHMFKTNAYVDKRTLFYGALKLSSFVLPLISIFYLTKSDPCCKSVQLKQPKNIISICLK